MRVTPRTWPSTRPRRLMQDCLVSLFMLVIYPMGVYRASPSIPYRGISPPEPIVTNKEDHGAHAHSCCSGHKASAPTVAHTVKDPVCGMSVNPETAKHKATYQGETFYFCSAGCKAK